MTSPYATVIKGGPPYLGRWSYNFKCPTGSYVTKFNGLSGGQVDRIGIECSDGETIFADGGMGGNAFQIDSQNKGFQSVMGTGFNGGNEYQSFNGFGRTSDNSPYPADVYQYRCPLDQYITGIDGTIESSLVKTLNVTCDNKSDYCVKNLDSPYCKWLMPQLKFSSSAKDKATYHNILNQACAINMSDTCRSNQTDLETSMVANWCKTHMDDDFCSCYATPPDFIRKKAPEVSGLPQCWNQTCSLKGFKPITTQSCPSITICRQEITTEGDNNLSSNVEVKQDCNPTVVIGTTGGVPSKNPDMTTVTNSTQKPIDEEPSSVSWWSNKYVLYFIIFLILIFVIIMFWDDDEPVNLTKLK